MELKELTVRKDNYCCIKVEDVPESWKNAFLESMEFQSWDELVESGNEGSFEIECNLSNGKVSEGTVIYFTESYKDSIELDDWDIKHYELNEYISDNWKTEADKISEEEHLKRAI